MRIAVPKETLPGEHRVALVPESVKRLIKKGFSVSIEAGAGHAAGFPDAVYLEAGATLLEDPATLLGQADVVLGINTPEPIKLAMIREEAVLVGFLKPLTDHEQVRRIAGRKLTSFAMELVPRTTLAQSMDALSSMATVSGYKAVLLAAEALPRFFPMLTTAAGTVAPAKVLILGAGVAGLQAIATARRLGAQVEAFDQRPACKEQVESLGARFIEVPADGEDAQTEGGYAKELSEDYKRRQAELIAQRIARADVVITTALIPGKRAPILIPEDFVAKMAPGSVIIDLAAEMGGNCAHTQPGEVVVAGPGVKVVGTLNLPASMPLHASTLYSRNLEKLLMHLATAEGLKADREEAIMKGCMLTSAGEVVHATVKPLMEAHHV